MDKKLASRILVILSMVYGITLGLMAVLDAPGISTTAIIGAVVLGLLWAMTGLFGRTESEGTP